ncbi:dihydrodipicolinate synthase family protein [Candidatus Bathyarchaeota archaeon]|nr:dihydrodipicolinate synthase family protein [Candidatus Bathyarchaeota archaeon]
MFKPEGIFPALVTPFTDDGKAVDENRLRFLVNRCIELGVHGVVPCGTTGEFVNMTIEERKQVIKVVVDEVNGRLPVIVGTGAS